MPLPLFTRQTDDPEAHTPTIYDAHAATVNEMMDELEPIAAATLHARYSGAQTLSATLQLADSDYPIQRFNCNGANRIVKLPAYNAANHPFFIMNVTAATYTLDVQSNAGVTLLSTPLAALTGCVLVVPDGTAGYKVVGSTPTWGDIVGTLSDQADLVPGWIPGTGTWSYSSGVRSQAYTNDPAAGSDIALNVADTSGFNIGDKITVSSSAGSEDTYISALVANTSITAAKLALNHTTTSPLITLFQTNPVISVNADVTALIGAGDRIKFTQTTVKYFIVMAVGSYSGGATLLTLFGGTDYALVNAAITLPYYSHAKAPFGFPLSPSKWAVETNIVTEPTVNTPTQYQWYGGAGATGAAPATPSLCLPIGAWDLSYQCVAFSAKNGTGASINTTLTTTYNSETDGDFTGMVEGDGATDANFYVFSSILRRKAILVAAKTTYYLSFRTIFTGIATMGLRGTYTRTIIRAICAYL